MSVHLTRRRFLQFSALATTAAGIAACAGGAPAPTEAPTEPPAATAAPEATTAPEATAVPVSKYKEAPMLAEMVAAGTLPPVEERLPKNPKVIPVFDQIGKHGGIWNRADVDASSIGHHHGAEGLLRYGPGPAYEIEPNLAERYEISEDGKEYTFYLREGVRWSDGEPFTADDIMYWYEDVLLNDELSPAKPRWLRPGGELVKVEKIDDYTVKFIFAVPFGLFRDHACFYGTSIVSYPKHYMSQFHVNYADPDELAQMIKDAGFEHWFQLHGSRPNRQRNPDYPTLSPWVITSDNWTTVATGQRNPYYWEVDEEGNQLPYFDKVQWHIVQAADMIPMRIVTGEVDMQAWSTGISNYTLYMESREAAGFDVGIWDYGGSGTSMHINQAKKVDPNDAAAVELRNLLKNLDFRIALSKAIDRDDINQLVYMGLSDPAIEVYPESVQNDPVIQDYYTLDVDAANAILDELGMTERDGDGMRLTPEGRRLDMTMIGLPMYAIHQDVAEVVVEFWREIGVRATMDWIAIELWWPRVQEGDYDIVAYESDYSSGNTYRLTYPRSYFPVETSTYWAGAWGTWYAYAGVQGEEPDHPDAKRLQDLYDQVVQVVDEGEKTAIMDEVFGIVAKNLWPIHTVGNRPEPCIVKRNVINVPEVGTCWWPVYGQRTTRPEQYSFTDV
ncbi:MAG: ABC transporter substrate-binding protein [Anaerolineae bacterium]|nr:ABC transporter substrate-binding protein [Anaerolineae bacterium]